jgi:3-hydroxyisobutyrate dehydrogenase-like beta-hydroxyacid dehydrogenase
MHSNVRVYGNGRSGGAYTDRLRQQGYSVSVYDRVGTGVRCVDGEPGGPAVVAIVAVPRGTDVPDALRAIDPGEVACVVDLTTQSPESAMGNAALWAGLGGRSYHAGGSNGGERAVRAGSSFLLVGPRCEQPVWQVLHAIGHVSEYDTVEYAVTLKLCHNAFLVVENELARQLVALCERRGIARQHLEKTIDDGPAGRRFGDLTALRHLKGGYPTSYVGEYAAKDWCYFQELLTDEERTLFGFVSAEGLARRLADRGTGAWV